MKTLLIATAAAALVSAGAASAQSPREITQQHFAQDHEPGDGSRRIFETSNSTVTVSTSNSSLAAQARAHFDQDHEPGDGARYRPGVTPTGTVISTSNRSLAAAAAAHLDNDDRVRRSDK